MILLDTNITSEPLRPVPEPRVNKWIDAQAVKTLFRFAITVAQLQAGVALLPAGKRMNVPRPTHTLPPTFDSHQLLASG